MAPIKRDFDCTCGAPISRLARQRRKSALLDFTTRLVTALAADDNPMRNANGTRAAVRDAAKYYPRPSNPDKRLSDLRTHEKARNQGKAERTVRISRSLLRAALNRPIYRYTERRGEGVRVSPESRGTASDDDASVSGLKVAGRGGCIRENGACAIDN